MRPDEAPPDVSVLVVSWNTCRLTEACLESLPASVPGCVTYETIVVDNGSIDGSVEMLRSRAHIRLVENGENRGFAAAVNQAYARSSGGLVLLLNSDVELKPGSLGELIAFLAHCPGVAGVGPIYLNPDGSPQQHHFRLPTFGMLLTTSSSVLRRLPRVSKLEQRYRMLGEDFSRPRPVEQPSASVLLLRRDVLPRDYLLDERFPIYFNDVELAHRLRQAGHELWVTPASHVVHVHGASTRQLGASLRCHHLAALVRYLSLTEPAVKVLAFRLLMLAQKATLRLLRRSDTLPLRKLVPALRGDPGPLPPPQG